MICIKLLQSKSQAKDFQYPDKIKGEWAQCPLPKRRKTANETAYKL